MKLPLMTTVQVALYAVWGRLTRPSSPAFNADNVESLQYTNPHGFFRQIREETPIFFSERTASWNVCAPYQLVSDLLTDERLSVRFKDWRFAPNIPEHKKNDLDRVVDGLLMSMDKKNHMRVRKLAAPAFSPRVIEKTREDIEEITDRYLKQIDVYEGFNLCEVSQAIPMEVVARFIGVPADCYEAFQELSNAIVASYMPSVKVNQKLALQGLTMLRDLVTEKKKNPGKDFLSVLISTVEDGDRMSEEEALALVMSVLAAGPETTKDYIDFAVRGLIENPAVLERVLDDKKLLPDAILEGSRWDNFAHGGAVRFALEDFEIHDQKIKKGEMLRLMIPFTHRDESVFERPDEFDLDRPNKDKIIRFGLGKHYCLGAALANLITETVVWELLSRYPELKASGKIVYEPHFSQRRMATYFLKQG